MLVSVVLPVVLMAGVAVRRHARRRRRERTQVAIDSSLAAVVDLMAVVIGSGGSLAEAVRVVADYGPEPTRGAFADVVGLQRRGQLLSEALVALSAALGAAFHPLASSLIVAEQSGTPVGLLLQRLADEAHLARNRATTEALGRLPVALLVPLVVCQLPALILGSVIPLAIVAVRHLG